MEKKENSIPSVAASESGIAQTTGVFPGGVVGPLAWELPSQSIAEAVRKAAPQRVIVPYAASSWPPEGYLSRSGHVEPRLNLRGPSRKAKYSLTTDSELVERSKDGKNPVEGRIVNLKPCAYKRSEPVKG